MQNLHETLQMVEMDSGMDLCDEFVEIKSILEYCDTHVRNLNKLRYFRGNEAFIQEISSRFRTMLRSRKFINSDYDPKYNAGPKLRKIVMFLFANTDATYKYNLREDSALGHVFEICPLLTRFLLVTLIWDLKLDKYFFEALNYTPCWFSFQFFDAAGLTMKNIKDPTDVLDKVRQLVCCIFVSLSRSNIFRMDAIDEKIIFGKLYDFTMNYLRVFYTPDAEKLSDFGSFEKYTYMGHVLRNLLEIVVFAFDVFEKGVTHEPEADLNIYKICQHVWHKNDETPPAVLSPLVKDYQLKIITTLFNSLQYNALMVDVQTYMNWVEVDITPTMTLQRSIAELSYVVRNRILENSLFAHDVEKHLKQIAVEPKKYEAIVAEATIGEVLRNLDDEIEDDLKLLWFNEIFKRKVCFGNEECIQSIKDNLNLITVENCKEILDYMSLDAKRIVAEGNEPMNVVLNKKKKMDNKNYEDLFSLIVESFDYLEVEEIIAVIIHRINIFDEAIDFACRLPKFESRLTRFINKIAQNFNVKEFLCLCLENPEPCWGLLYDSTSVHGKNIKTFCATVFETRPFSTNYFLKHINKAMTDHLKIQQNHFPYLLSEIYYVLYFPERKNEFLREYIYLPAERLTDEEKYRSLLTFVKTLNFIAARDVIATQKPRNFGEAIVALFLLIGRIMEKARWDLYTYSTHREKLIVECVKFLKVTSSEYVEVATPPDQIWINNVVSAYRPITYYYYEHFRITNDEECEPFETFLTRDRKHRNIDEKEIRPFLLANFVRCSMDEALMLFQNEIYLAQISEVMLLLTSVLPSAEQPNAIECFDNCVVMYGSIVDNLLIPKCMNQLSAIVEILLKVLNLIDKMPDQVYDRTFNNFQALFAKMFNQYSDSAEIQHFIKIKEFLDTMKDCRAKKYLLTDLQAIL